MVLVIFMKHLVSAFPFSTFIKILALGESICHIILLFVPSDFYYIHMCVLNFLSELMKINNYECGLHGVANDEVWNVNLVTLDEGGCTEMFQLYSLRFLGSANLVIHIQVTNRNNPGGVYHITSVVYRFILLKVNTNDPCFRRPRRKQ